MSGTESPRAIDLFCGAGGLTLGLAQAGFDVRAGIDTWPVAVATYGRNFDHPALLRDVASTSVAELRNEVDGIDDLALVAGGPPCQGFSIQRIGPDHDARNHLVLEFGRLAVELGPHFILMENVAGLTGTRGRVLLDRLRDDLLDGGYVSAVTTVNAGDYGVPQQRRRVLVLAWRQGLDEPGLPASVDPGRHPTVWDAIGDLPRPAPPGTVEADDPLHIESRLSALNRLRLEHIPPGGGFEHLPVELRVDCHKAGAAKIGHRGVYGRLHPDRPAGTITARFDSFTRGRFAHPYENRNVTLREGARLQTFPDTFRFNGSREDVAALIGNAVPPLLARRVGEALFAAATRLTRSGTRDVQPA